MADAKTRAVETALVMVDSLMDPDDSLTGIVYLQGFFYGKVAPSNQDGLEAVRQIGHIVLENLKQSDLMRCDFAFVRSRVADLLDSLTYVLIEEDLQLALELREEILYRGQRYTYENIQRVPARPREDEHDD